MADALTASAAIDLAKQCWETSSKERRRVASIADALRPTLDAKSITMPHDGGTPEMRKFAEKSRTNYLPLVVKTFAQSLRIVGYRGNDKTSNLAVWDLWQANGMDARQAGIFQAAVRFGYSYGLVLPGESTDSGAAVPLMRGRSPRRMATLYSDPIDDVWPEYALDIVDADTRRLIDDGHVYTLRRSGNDSDEWAVAKTEEHGIGLCPVVRFRSQIDLDDDMPMGVVENLIPIQARIDETVFGLLTAQHFTAFQQRWVTGWTVPKDKTTGQEQPVRTSSRHLLTFADDKVKVGQFPQADPKGYLDSEEAAIGDMAAIAQLPPSALAAGKMSNLAAEALAATSEGKNGALDEMKAALGEDAEQFMRLTARVAGQPEAAGDETAQARWADTTARSLAQIADALGKMAESLGIPGEALWERVPDVSQQDIEAWRALKAENDALGSLEAELARQVDAPKANVGNN